MKRAALPPGHVGLADLIGTRAVTWAQAYVNRTRLVTPAEPRPRRPGLVPLDAAALWSAIAKGTFVAPVRGPWGLAWPLDGVYRWRRHNPK